MDAMGLNNHNSETKSKIIVPESLDLKNVSQYGPPSFPSLGCQVNPKLQANSGNSGKVHYHFLCELSIYNILNE